MKKIPKAPTSTERPKTPAEPELLERILGGLDALRLTEMRRVRIPSVVDR